ncbi:hypothetical protein ACFO3A_13180 [Comamonas nitrativorans]|uniref:EF-hand domain-containing protein n=1 Tax=Comamonas nitrativorans TaxID=108437 RepID=A0ABV9GY61_9BURK
MQQHRWQFVRAGGVDQVVIRTGADIAHLAELDQKLWVALACPTRGVEFDPATLDVIDDNTDGRIRAPELLAACQWAVAHVRDPEVLASGADVLQLDSIHTASDSGAAMHAEARRILALAGQADSSTITLAQVQERLADLSAMALNGDGILNPAKLPADAVDLQALAQRIMDAYGASTGCDGEPGLAQPALEQFFADVAALADWQAQAPAQCCGLESPAQVCAAAQVLSAVQAKVDDFFARCRLAAFDAKALQPLSPSEEGYATLGQQALSAGDAAIAALPLATLDAAAVLPLTEGINPAWIEAVQALHAQVVTPLLGEQTALSWAQWRQVCAQLAPCQAWLAARPQSPVGDLPLEEAQALLAGDSQQRLQALIDQDSAEAAHSLEAKNLEKLIRLQRDLLALLNNFVSFSSFYSRAGAMFQAGTLYLDGRSCELTVDVQDTGAHAALAGLAKTFLAYCECRRGDEVRHIVAAFTAGDVDFLFVGRKGIFYDRQGQDWDARITTLIENPTSIGQAFFSPYKKFLRFIEEQVAQRAASKDAAITEGLQAKAASLAAGAPPADVPKKTDVGTVAAIGVALGSISTVLVAILSKVLELGPWIPLAMLGLVLAISGPSMLIAWLKLRERSLGPILDASGWAINGRMKINLPLGRSLSQQAQVPANAHRSLYDPYAQKSPARWWLAAALVLLLAGGAWSQGWLNAWLPQGWQPTPAVVAEEQAVEAAAAETAEAAEAVAPAAAEAGQ